MLYDKFGKHVIQTMFDIAIKVKFEGIKGESIWFDRIAEHILRHRKELLRHSSGRKIVEKLYEVSNFFSISS